MNILDNTDQNDQIQIDPNKDYLEVLLGPGGKYDVSKYDGDREAAMKALARGKYEGDLYIDHMKGRHDELREDYLKIREQNTAGQNVKEVLDQYMAELRQSQNALPPVQEDKSVFDEAKLGDLIKQHLQANKQIEREESNARNVENKLQQSYGPNYKQVVKQQIDQLGMSVDFFNDLARKHPEVLYKTLGVGEQHGELFQAPPTSTQGSVPFGTSNKRTWSFYEKMRKTDPVAYRDPKTQNQMFKDAMALGPAFEDGDFHKR